MGSTLMLEEITRYRKILAGKPLSLRRQIKGMDPRRADVIVAGTSILQRFIEFLEVEEVLVSTKGIRYGLALSQG